MACITQEELDLLFPNKVAQAVAIRILDLYLERKIALISEIHNYGKYGTIRLEEWPEGLVLWAGGQLRWKSWED